jgi:serine/threonine protein kinase
MAIEMLRTIEACHKLGIVHGDVKPSNFLLKSSRRFPLALIDFGLSIVQKSHHPEDHAFMGTLKYASVDAHRGKEVVRRDDLISWFYTVVEMWAGKLPWSKVADQKKICAMKLELDMIRYIRKMPRSVQNVWKLIKKLIRKEEPEYKLMMAFLEKAMTEVGAQWEDPYDWARMDLSQISAIEIAPQDEREPLTGLPQAVMPTWAGLLDWDPESLARIGSP